MSNRLTTAELAALVGVTPVTVRNAARWGQIPGAELLAVPGVAGVYTYPATAPGGEPWPSWWERERRVGRPKRAGGEP